MLTSGYVSIEDRHTGRQNARERSPGNKAARQREIEAETAQTYSDSKEGGRERERERERERGNEAE